MALLAGMLALVAGTALQSSWTPRAAPPSQIKFAAVALGPNGRVYVFGGETQNRAQTLIYDPRTDAWSRGASMPVASTEPGAALGPNGKIYVIGGNLQGPGRRASGATLEYDPVLDRWESRAPIPTPRAAFALVAGKNRQGKTLLYAIGGRDFIDQRNGLDTVEAYDPLLDKWSTCALMPTCRHALAATLGPDGRIYAVGGASSVPNPGYRDAFERYDPRTNRWEKLAPVPHVIECTELAATSGRHGRIYMYGGRPDQKAAGSSTLYEYDLHANQWARLPDGPVPIGAGVSVILRQKPESLLFIGGRTCLEWRR